MKAPILKNNEHSVLVAEFSTGIVLTTGFKRYLGDGKVFHIFPSHELALEFINKELTENSDYEFNIYNSKGTY